ncbi:uncharacterized protein L201_007691 [Kwoniella dendrophila CBS 6074]|uniref:Glycosyl transferase CAP10 domain-containing protein n=1 Tax=Kwoniella dendrophila CBS 6074 TaxID=1295534 RepID=A0AAX4K515_9TREE
MSIPKQTSPKTLDDSFVNHSFSNNAQPSSSNFQHSYQVSTHQIEKQLSSSSSRRSSSRRSSNSSTDSDKFSITSQSSLDEHDHTYPILPTYNSDNKSSSSYFGDGVLNRSNSSSRRTSIISIPGDTKKRILNTLKPRRRSSLPFIHLARRKSSQLIMVFSILVVGLLLVSEVRSHRLRKELWSKAITLNEWDIKYSTLLNKETNLKNFRKEYEFKRRLELKDQIEGKSTVINNVRKRSALELLNSVEEEEQGIWGPEQEEALQIEINNAWPKWWGNPDSEEIGKSPFDHTPNPLRPGQAKRRFMFLTDYNDYLERMNTHTYEIVDAALRHPHLIVDVWGPGWEGYNRSIPLSHNVRNRQNRIARLEQSKEEFDQNQIQKTLEMENKLTIQKKREWISRRFEVTRSPQSESPVLDEGSIEAEWAKPPWSNEYPDECNEQTKFDVVFTISNIFNENDPHVDALDCDTVLIQQLGDCHELRCSYEWYPHANNITVSKYAFELLELFEHDKVKAKYPDWRMGLFGHSPDTGNEWDFYPIPWSERTAKAKVFGYDGSFYPIRTTVTDAIRSIEKDPETLEQSIITRHPHPGYTVSVSSEARQTPLETYELNHEYYETHQKLREDFANGMRQSKICVFDASLERKMIRKYAQAFLSGCVVASDLPTEHEESLSKFIIPLKSTWSIEKINEMLNYYLERDDLLQQMALDGFIWARQHMTTTNKITHLLEMADHYRQGSRGYEFPYGFSMRCRSYWSGDAYRPPWCSEEGYRGLEE